MLDEIIKFGKDNGLSLLTSIATNNPAPIALKLIGDMLGLKDGLSQDDVLEKLNTDPQLVIRLREIDAHVMGLIMDDRKDARLNNYSIINSNNSTWFNRHFKDIFAMVSTLVMLSTIFGKSFGAEIPDMAVGAIVGNWTTVMTYYYGSSDIKK